MENRRGAARIDSIHTCIRIASASDSELETSHGKLYGSQRSSSSQGSPPSPGKKRTNIGRRLSPDVGTSHSSLIEIDLF